MKSRNSPVSRGREDTFYNPASDESFALGQRLQDLFEKASSPRLISIIYKQQNHTQVWVIKQSWKRPQQNTAVSETKDNTVEYESNFSSQFVTSPASFKAVGEMDLLQK